MATLAPREIGIAMKKIESAARERARSIAQSLADKALLFGIRAELTAEGVRLSARHLRAHMADDPALRWIAGWLK